MYIKTGHLKHCIKDGNLTRNASFPLISRKHKNLQSTIQCDHDRDIFVTIYTGQLEKVILNTYRNVPSIHISFILLIHWWNTHLIDCSASNCSDLHGENRDYLGSLRGDAEENFYTIFGSFATHIATLKCRALMHVFRTAKSLYGIVILLTTTFN